MFIFAEMKFIKMKKPITILSIILFVTIICIMTAKALFWGNYSGSQIRINIPEGTSDVPLLLRKNLGDSFGGKVARLWKLQNEDASVSHGSYLIENGDNSFRVARKIAKGYQTPVRFTFNNTRTISELAAKVSAALEVDSATFINVADTFLTARGFAREEEAAAFIPDTYELYWTVSPERLVDKLYETREIFWTQERKDKAKNLGLTPTEVHTLASIVEGETNKNDEKGMIARLYLNRLKKEIPLQADPTVKFALKKFDLRRITSENLKYSSPFNTYINKGLPPGPITIVERNTLDQVLEAPVHDYLYMCAKSDFSGYHDFATTYERHRINAARYHRALDKRGIKN